MNIKENYLIFYELLRRDCKVTFYNFKSILIDSLIMASVFSILFGYLLPELGMNNKFSIPLFLGSVVLVIISQSFSRTVKIKSDLEHARYINFQLTLPVSKKWLLAEYIVAFALDIIVSALPSLILGIFILNNITNYEINVLAFILILLLTSIFFSCLFLLIAFATKWPWFINNTWEKILVPLMHTGAVYFFWKSLYNFSPIMANVMLINPLIYINEGLRSSLFGSSEFISEYICIFILTIWILIILKPLWYVLHNKLDLVN